MLTGTAGLDAGVTKVKTFSRSNVCMTCKMSCYIVRCLERDGSSRVHQYISAVNQMLAQFSIRPSRASDEDVAIFFVIS